MNKLLLLHGPNLNRLGERDAAHYGKITLDELVKITSDAALALHYQIIPFQSNHEGVLIDYLQKEARYCQGIIINLGALTHYSYALHDALLDTGLPIVEVHLSNIAERETWRQHSVTEPICLKVISGKRELGYVEAVQVLVEHLRHA